MVEPQPLSIYGTGVNNRPLVYLNTGMLGAQYRGLKNQYVAVNFHGYFGVSHGTFDYSLQDLRASGRVLSQVRAVLESHEADGGAGWQHRLQPVEEVGDTVFAGSDPGTLRDGDAGVCCGVGWGDLPVREEDRD